MKSIKNGKVAIQKIKEDIASNLDLPNEVALNLPLITITGRSKIVIENFKSILEYSGSTIKISTSVGVFQIEGNNLHLKELSKVNLLIRGTLVKFEFII